MEPRCRPDNPWWIMAEAPRAETLGLNSSSPHQRLDISSATIAESRFTELPGIVARYLNSFRPPQEKGRIGDPSDAPQLRKEAF